MNNLKFRMFDSTMKYFDLEDVYYNNINPFHGVYDVRIMQSTGHYDKNGKEIYIGDLVRFSEIDVPYEVTIDDFSKIPVLNNESDQVELHKCFKFIEIVGNIYEWKLGFIRNGGIDMREIKFRAWDSDESKMIGWYDEFFSDMSPVTRWSSYFSFIEMPLMQYSGLKDKNGKEIYEGDILLCVDELDGTTIRKGYVIFERGSYWIDYEPSYLVGNDIMDEDIEYEIIGNIYENPDLINHPYIK